MIDNDRLIVIKIIHLLYMLRKIIMAKYFYDMLQLLKTHIIVRISNIYYNIWIINTESVFLALPYTVQSYQPYDNEC